MLFLTALPDLSALELGIDQICLRLLCAMLVGMVIGPDEIHIMEKPEELAGD